MLRDVANGIWTERERERKEVSNPCSTYALNIEKDTEEAHFHRGEMQKCWSTLKVYWIGKKYGLMLFFCLLFAFCIVAMRFYFLLCGVWLYIGNEITVCILLSNELFYGSNHAKWANWELRIAYAPSRLKPTKEKANKQRNARKKNAKIVAPNI